jgi:G3E family GTPase
LLCPPVGKKAATKGKGFNAFKGSWNRPSPAPSANLRPQNMIHPSLGQHCKLCRQHLQQGFASCNCRRSKCGGDYAPVTSIITINHHHHHHHHHHCWTEFETLSHPRFHPENFGDLRNGLASARNVVPIVG